MAEERRSETVTISIEGGPSAVVPWTEGMTAMTALERAYDAIGSTTGFSFAVQFFGSELGHLVCMINETYDTFQTSSEPFFYWEFLVNGQPVSQGVEHTKLVADDEVSFRFARFEPETYAGTLLAAKHARRHRAIATP